MSGKSASRAIMSERDDIRDAGEPLMSLTRKVVANDPSLQMNIPKPLTQMMDIEAGDDLAIDMYSNFAIIRHADSEQ